MDWTVAMPTYFLLQFICKLITSMRVNFGLFCCLINCLLTYSFCLQWILQFIGDWPQYFSLGRDVSFVRALQQWIC